MKIEKRHTGHLPSSSAISWSNINELEQIASTGEAAGEVFKLGWIADKASLCAILSKRLHVGIHLDGDTKIVRHLDDFAKRPSPNGLMQERGCSLAALFALSEEVCVEDKAVAID